MYAKLTANLRNIADIAKQTLLEENDYRNFSYLCEKLTLMPCPLKKK